MRTRALATVTLAAALYGLAGCATVGPVVEAGARLETKVGLTEAYRIIERQARACYRAVGGLGGVEVQGVLDNLTGTATVDVFEIGLRGPVPFEDSAVSRRITLQRVDQLSTSVTVVGTDPRRMQPLHRVIPLWLAGQAGCWPPAI